MHQCKCKYDHGCLFADVCIENCVYDQDLYDAMGLGQMPQFTTLGTVSLNWYANSVKEKLENWHRDHEDDVYMDKYEGSAAAQSVSACDSRPSFKEKFAAPTEDSLNPDRFAGTHFIKIPSLASFVEYILVDAFIRTEALLYVRQ